MTERKLRYSRQRERIYEYLKSTPEHPSAEMIYEALRPEMPNLSLGTVYRNLKLLEEMGRIQRVTSSQNVERYDARCSDHAHFICEACGSICDLEVVDRNAIERACNISGTPSVHSLHVTFTGLCEACLNNASQNNEKIF